MVGGLQGFGDFSAHFRSEQYAGGQGNPLDLDGKAGA
jgi:hypothetical protein